VLLLSPLAPSLSSLSVPCPLSPDRRPSSPAEERLLGEDGVQFLEKPFTLKALARCLAAALGRS
jgi:hypothetical protein